MTENRASETARDLVMGRLVAGIISINRTSQALQKELRARLGDFVHEPLLSHDPILGLPTPYCLPPRELERFRHITTDILLHYSKALGGIGARTLMQLCKEIERQFPGRLVIDESPDRYFLLARTRRYFLWVQDLMKYGTDLRGDARLQATRAILGHVDFRKNLIAAMRYVENIGAQGIYILDHTADRPIFGLLPHTTPQETNQVVIDLGIVLRRTEEALSSYEQDLPKFDLGKEISRMIWMLAGRSEMDVPTATHSLMGGMRNRIDEIIHLKFLSRASNVARIFENDFRLARFERNAPVANMSAAARTLREISGELAYLTNDHTIRAMRQDKVGIWITRVERHLKVPIGGTDLDFTPLLSFALESGDMRRVRNACLSIALYLEGVASGDSLLASANEIRLQCQRLFQLSKTL